jgi:tripartite-type tricarboxylate transporter receptor subunit TctC
MAPPGPHIYGELFKMMADVDLFHVPYRAVYMPNLLVGQVQVTFMPIPQSSTISAAANSALLRQPQRSGWIHYQTFPTSATRCRTTKRAAFLPWARHGTPTEIISKPDDAISAGLADPRIKARLLALGDDDPRVRQPFQKPFQYRR